MLKQDIGFNWTCRLVIEEILLGLGSRFQLAVSVDIMSNFWGSSILDKHASSWTRPPSYASSRRAERRLVPF
jgi:hypothetical protein